MKIRIARVASAILLAAIACCVEAAVLTPPAHATPAEAFLRLHNPQSLPRTIVVSSKTLSIEPHGIAELPADGPLTLDPTGLLVTWRLVDADAEAQVQATTAATACGDPVQILMAGTACRFGTAGALVEDIAGATYKWTVDGGAILSGDGTASPVFSFGATSSAVVRVELTASGCTRTGMATIALRAPFEIASFAATPANVGSPATLAWTYRDDEAPRTQRLTIAGQAIVLPVSARMYTFTPATAGAVEALLDASLYGGRRRAVGHPGPRVPSPSSCASDRRGLSIAVRPACTLPQGEITTSGPTTFCDGGSVTLTAPEGAAYEWNTGARTRTITASSSGLYQVRVANGPDCDKVFGPLEVRETPRPAIALSLAPTSIETGGAATLTVTCQRCAGGSVSSARGPGSLTPNGGAFTGSGTFTFTFTDTQGPASLTFTATGTALPPCSQAATDQKTLSIVAPAPRIESFTGDSYIVTWFQATTLRFTIANAASWRLHSSRGNGRTPSSGTGSGSFTSQYTRGSQAGPDIITLEVTGTNGAVITRDLPQPIEGPAQIISFIADSYTVPFFGTTTLRFTINYAASWRLLSSRGNCKTPSSGMQSGDLTSQYSRCSAAGADTITLEVTGKDGIVIARDLPQPIN